MALGAIYFADLVCGKVLVALDDDRNSSLFAADDFPGLVEVR